MSFKPSSMSHNPGCPCLGCGPYGFSFIKDFKARRADPSGANQGYSTGESSPAASLMRTGPWVALGLIGVVGFTFGFTALRKRK